MKAFFPGHILETGHDILFFWVARMVMMSLCLMDELPFTEVYLHPLIKDKQGKKMSKSLGNVIDPLEVIDGCTLDVLQEKLKSSNLAPKEVQKGLKDKEKEFPNGIPPCGSDSLRFALLAYMTQPRTINLDVNRIIGYRLFCSKIWNAVKFALIYYPENFVPSKAIMDFDLSYADKWILCKLQKVIRSSNENLKNYLFGAFANDLYDFFQKDFCDSYIEASKVILQGADCPGKTAALNTIYVVLDNSLRLFHPVMPYITEELYHRLSHPDQGGDAKANQHDIYNTPYPQDLEEFKAEEDIESRFASLLAMIAEIRVAKDSIGIQKNLRPEIFIKTNSDELKTILNDNIGIIKNLSFSGTVTILNESDSDPEGCVRKTFHIGESNLLILVKISGIIDIKQEIQRLQKLKAKNEGFIDATSKKLSGKAAEKMPESVKLENQDKIAKLIHENAAIDSSIEELQKIQ